VTREVSFHGVRLRKARSKRRQHGPQRELHTREGVEAVKAIAIPGGSDGREAPGYSNLAPLAVVNNPAHLTGPESRERRGPELEAPELSTMFVGT